ncbi:DUF2332 family protein [Arthrobacter pigmenti]
MTGLDPCVATAENYRRFARWEAAGRSPLYARLAEAVADDEVVLTFLGGLAAEKRQPNLLFAAARYLLGLPPDPGGLHTLVAERSDELAHVMNTRRTQTNEAARCAVMLPARGATLADSVTAKVLQDAVMIDGVKLKPDSLRPVNDGIVSFLYISDRIARKQ